MEINLVFRAENLFISLVEKSAKTVTAPPHCGASRPTEERTNILQPLLQHQYSFCNIQVNFSVPINIPQNFADSLCARSEPWCWTDITIRTLQNCCAHTSPHVSKLLDPDLQQLPGLILCHCAEIHRNLPSKRIKQAFHETQRHHV